MIKCEVVFDGSDMYCNNKKIEYQCGDGGSCYFYVDYIEMTTLEQAINYCLNN